MMKKSVISALYVEETGEVKCGYCGKKLCKLQKNSKKFEKRLDKQNYLAIIKLKCGRCCHENEVIL